MRKPLIAFGVTIAMVMSLLNPGSSARAETDPDLPVSLPITGAEEGLGHAIPGSFLSPESSLGVDKDGNLLAFYVSNGNSEVPMMLQVLDVERQKVVFQQRVEAGINSWANVYSEVEKRLYFASTEGHLYSWAPGDTTITSHGIPFPGQGIWRLAVAPDGTIYGGTYPDGLLFTFNRVTGTATSLGQVNEGETYVRSIAADDDYVYVGSQPNAKLVRVDRRTGAKTEMTVPVSPKNTVYDLTVAGGYLFARVESANSMVVYDLDDLSVVNTVEKVTGRVISGLDPTGSFVLFRMANGVTPTGLYRYYLADHRVEYSGFNPNAFPGAFFWHRFDDQVNFPGYTMVMTYYRGRIYSYNFQTRKSAYLGESLLEPTPNPIQTIGTGPDGKIYVPGFLSPPSMAQFDPSTDTFTQLPGAGQVEGLGSFDDLLLMGRYPNGLLATYDTTRPWANGSNPREPLSIGFEQDRPQSMVRVGNEVAVASVPKSGRLGGAITMWDPLTGAMRVFNDIVENQSIVSLAEKDGLIYAGTSINGGYGIDPVATDAKLIIVDPKTGKKLFESAPLPGATNIAALEFDSDGKLWAIANGALLKFDPEQRRFEAIEQVFPKTNTMYGSQQEIIIRDDGYLYATSAGSLWRVDRVSFERIRMASNGVRHLAMDRAGNLYYGRVSRLFRWNFDLARTVDGTAPATLATVANAGQRPDRVSVTLTARDSGAGVAETQYRVDGGPWQTYTKPVTFPSGGTYSVEYRSIDRDRNVEGTRVIEVVVRNQKGCGNHGDNNKSNRGRPGCGNVGGNQNAGQP